jgi:phage tail-like protein
MADGDALSTHIFGLQLGAYMVESLQEVSGVTIEEDVVEISQVTPQGKPLLRKQPGARKGGEITVTRGMDKSKEFTKWLKETVNKGDVEKARQNITIEIMNSKGETERRLNLVNGWVSKWEGPALKAGESGAAIEKVTITFEDITLED